MNEATLQSLKQELRKLYQTKRGVTFFRKFHANHSN